MADEYDLEEAFHRIENELLESLKRRLERGLTDEEIENNYQIWQLEQLEALNQYRFIEDKKFTGEFKKLNKKLTSLIIKTAEDARLKEVTRILTYVAGAKVVNNLESQVILLDRNKLNNLVESVTHDMEKAEYATLRMVDDKYRKIIFDAQVNLNTGSTSLRGAIDQAAHDFFANGINSIQYKNGAQVNIASYSEMALRTANKRAALQGAAMARDEYGLDLVIINYRGVACPRCAQFMGRVCIDDVFGNGKADGKHPLLSEFIEGGLYHPNCKDGHSTYYEGVTEIPKRPTKADMEEAHRIYDLEQRQRYNERQIRKYKRLEDLSLDPQNKEKATAKRKQWQAIQREFVKENDVLRRKYDREKYYKP